jgi:AcrR family transcriptional regulator
VIEAAQGGSGSPGDGSEGPPRVRLDRQRRRESLLDAGAKAFAERGFQATSMEEVAGIAGVTRLIVYRHFNSKKDLYRAVLDRAVSGVAAAVSEKLAGGPTVRGSVDGFLMAARRDPFGFKLLVRQSAREPDFADYPERFRDSAVQAAKDLIARRVPDNVLRDWAARTLVSLLEESTLAWIEEGSPERDEEMADVLTSSIVAMLGAFSASPEA